MPCSSRSPRQGILTPGGRRAVRICCLLGTVPLLKAWPHRQGIGRQLAIGLGGRVKSDGPGQPHTLLGGLGLAALAQGPVETTVAPGFTHRGAVSLCQSRSGCPPLSAPEECSLSGCLLANSEEMKVP